MVRHNKSPFRLFKRGEIWHTYFSVVVSGQRIVVRESTGCTDETAAKEYCAKRLREITSAPAVTHEITLDAAVAKYYLEYGQYLSNPIDVLSKIKNLLKYFDKRISLSAISKLDISNFISIQKKQNRTNATINRYLCLLSGICKRAKEYWDCKIPDFKILQFKLKEPRENIKYFKTAEEVQNLIDAAAPHLKPILYTALFTGLRLGRILTLKWEQIDWGNNQIIYIGKDAQPHSVPMVSALKEILMKIPKINEFVFNYNNKPIKSIKSAYRAAFVRSGIAYKNFHTFRHTTATWLLRDTGNLKIVQRTLGHHSLTITNRYAHLVNNETESALEHLFTQKLHTKEIT